LFAEWIESVHLRWESGLEWYLLKTDQLIKKFETRWAGVQFHLNRFSERPQNSRKMLQLTISGLIITFAVLLFSCQSTATRAPSGLPQTRRFEVPRPDRDVDQLYLRRDELLIKNKEAGSSTGSIWADSSEPRVLFNDPAPNKEGQTVTVVIPDELQFDPKSAAASTPEKSKDKKDKKPQDAASDPLKLTDPDSLSPSLQVAQTPIKSLKMQIVSFEPGGDVYLRGSRRFKSPQGEENVTMVLAKVPRRALTGYEIDARDLTDVAVNEDVGGKLREYSAQGWDEVVSRRLAGFAPDLQSELNGIEDLRNEIRSAQNVLREQAKANEMERDRVRKDRERLSQQAAGAGGASSPASNQNSNSPNEPDGKASGKDVN
jgi:hypothetical protein